MENTLCIIKPDAVKNGFIEDINEKIKESGIKITKSKRLTLDREIAENFYAEHSERPFFRELVDFMTSGDCVIQVLDCLLYTSPSPRDVRSSRMPSSA